MLLIVYCGSSLDSGIGPSGTRRPLLTFHYGLTPVCTFLWIGVRFWTPWPGLQVPFPLLFHYSLTLWEGLTP